MADLFRVAPGGLNAIKPRTGSWIAIRGVVEVGAAMQFTAAPVWTVAHNLGRMPNAVQVRTMGGIVVDADIRHQDENVLRVHFDAPIDGVVDLS